MNKPLLAPRLTAIIERKQQRVVDAQRQLTALRDQVLATREQTDSTADTAIQAQQLPVLRGFYHKLLQQKQAGKHGIIAELKQASPSRGVICQDFAIARLAPALQSGGATCLSVLTEQDAFLGAPENIALTRKHSMLPIIRKDFIFTELQVYESRGLGADCILLILAMLTSNKAAALEQLAINLGLDVLIEVHNQRELEAAINMRSKLIGINSRNLQDFSLDPAIIAQLARQFQQLVESKGRDPSTYVLVAESGIANRSQIDEALEHGIDAFLIGESLMRAEHPAALLAEFSKAAN